MREQNSKRALLFGYRSSLPCIALRAFVGEENDHTNRASEEGKKSKCTKTQEQQQQIRSIEHCTSYL